MTCLSTVPITSFRAAAGFSSCSFTGNPFCLPADQPRIVQHVDDTFRRKVSQLYRQTIPADGAVLDLMSSWVSHLPEDVNYSLVVGHGMNAQEVSTRISILACEGQLPDAHHAHAASTWQCPTSL